MYQTAYDHHFSEPPTTIFRTLLYTLPHYRRIFVYPSFSSVPGRSSVSTVDERGHCSIIVYDDLL